MKLEKGADNMNVGQLSEPSSRYWPPIKQYWRCRQLKQCAWAQA